MTGELKQLAGALIDCGYSFIFNHDCDDEGRESFVNAICSAVNMHGMSGPRRMARRLQTEIARIDALIQPCNDEVCPRCDSVCCLNKFGRYDVGDIVYLAAIGCRPEEILSFGSGDSDFLPCRYLSDQADQGCSISRQLRPFRCNWYFCIPTIEYLENGSKRNFRSFTMFFQEIIRLRKTMLDEFHAVVNALQD